MTRENLTEAWQKWLNMLADPELWFRIFTKGLTILLIWIGVRIAIRTGTILINRILDWNEKGRIRFDQRRLNTIRNLLKNVLRYSVSFMGILLILEQLGVPVGPIIAGAGVLGLAVAFGAQNLVRDVITGFFIIFEDQFAVGDYVRVGNFEGTVEEIGLRITKIKSFTGEVHIIPNGSITEVTNFSTSNSVAVLDISVAYEENIQRVQDILEKKIDEIYEKGMVPDLVKKPQVLGVQHMDVSHVIFRIIAECKPMTHFAVKRKLNALIKETFDQEGIEIPYPRMVTIQQPGPLESKS